MLGLYVGAMGPREDSRVVSHSLDCISVYSAADLLLGAE
jgi:hypothetical protein